MMRTVRWLVQPGVLTVIAVQLGGFAQSFHPLFDSVAHFRVHLAALLAIGVILLLLFGSWRLAAAGVAMIGASLLMTGPAIGPQREVDAPSLTLLQFNTLF